MVKMVGFEGRLIRETVTGTQSTFFEEDRHTPLAEYKQHELTVNSDTTIVLTAVDNDFRVIEGRGNVRYEYRVTMFQYQHLKTLMEVMAKESESLFGPQEETSYE